MNQKNSPLDPHQAKIKAWTLEGLSNTKLARKIKKELGIKTSEASVRRAIKRWVLLNPILVLSSLILRLIKIAQSL